LSFEGEPFARLVLVFVSLAFLLVWAQVFLMHARSNFHRREQYVPVLEAPVLVLAGAWLVLLPSQVAYVVFLLLHALAVIAGLFGFYLHWRAVAAHVGGINMRNLMGGPPVVLPIVYSALAGLGILAAWWGLGR
jgi:hypothetical protein